MEAEKTVEEEMLVMSPGDKEDEVSDVEYADKIEKDVPFYFNLSCLLEDESIYSWSPKYIVGTLSGDMCNFLTGKSSTFF